MTSPHLISLARICATFPSPAAQAVATNLAAEACHMSIIEGLPIPNDACMGCGSLLDLSKITTQPNKRKKKKHNDIVTCQKCGTNKVIKDTMRKKRPPTMKKTESVPPPVVKKARTMADETPQKPMTIMEQAEAARKNKRIAAHAMSMTTVQPSSLAMFSQALTQQ